MQSSINTNQPMLLRKNLIWQSWNSNKAVTLKPPKTIYIFKVQNRHWIMQWSTANEKIQTKTIYHLGNSTKMFFIQPELKKNNLSLNEKLEIVNYKGNNLLNKKMELISKGKHQNKYILSKYDTKDWRWLHCKKSLYLSFCL